MRIRSAFLLQVASAVLPAAVMLLTVPLIRHQVDLETFAAFTVMLSAMGLLAALDGGLGRSSTYFVRLALSRTGVARAMPALQGVVVVGMLFSAAVVPLVAVVLGVLSGRAVLLARPALLILAAFVPLFVLGSLLRGYLEARQQFGRSTALQLAQGMVTGIAPLVLFAFTTDLRWLAWTIGAIRICLIVTLFKLCDLDLRRLLTFSSRTRLHASRVFSYSKWLFVSNLVGLTILFADRFFVAGVFSSVVIAAYVLPMEVIARLQILVAAFCSVVFPRLVGRAQTQESQAIVLMSDAQGLVLCCAAAVGGALLVFSHPLMRWWLGEALAAEASRVLIVGMVGAGLMASAALSLLFLNSRGSTRPVALLHVLEMPVYVALLWCAASARSVEMLLGAWLLRLVVDVVSLTAICRFGSSPTTRRAMTGVLDSSHWFAVVASLLILMSTCLMPIDLSNFARWSVMLVTMFLAALAGRTFFRRVRGSPLLSARFA